MKQRKYPMYWNLRTNPECQEAEYYFVIANSDEREITDVTNKIAEQLPTVNLRSIDGKIDSINYRVLIVEAFNSKLDIGNIGRAYNGKLIRDKRLYERKNNQGGLETYVSNKIKDLG